MGKILEAFATDCLVTDTTEFEKSPEYQAAKKAFCKYGERLMEKLNPEEKQLLQEFSEAKDTQETIYAIDRFIKGFRLGVLMMIEVFTGNDGLNP